MSVLWPVTASVQTMLIASIVLAVTRVYARTGTLVTDCFAAKVDIVSLYISRTTTNANHKLIIERNPFNRFSKI